MLAKVPRQRDLSSILVSYQSRIRREEVNRKNAIVQGDAIYTLTPPTTSADTWTPDWSTAVKQIDTIGCTPTAGGIIIPPYWKWWGNVTWQAHVLTPPPTGEAMLWSAVQNATFTSSLDVAFGAYRSDIMFDSSGSAGPQQFGAEVHGSTSGNVKPGIYVPGAQTVMGSLFVVSAAAIFISGIQLFGNDLPEAGSPH